MMKLALAFLALAPLITGCATSTFTMGRQFPTDNVANIVKGQTTAQEITQMFGEPLTKTVLSDSAENWNYSYYTGSAHAQSYLVSMKVDSQSNQTVLNVVLRDGVVTNYTFTQGAGPSMQLR